MNFKSVFFSFIAKGVNTGRLCNSARPLVIHPFYHTVTDDYLPHLHPLYKVKSVREFKKDLDFLMTYFQAVDINRIFSYANGTKSLKENAFHLSFDDGLREVYTTLLPYLYQKGIPATIFVNSAFVDNKELFYRHKAALIVDVLNKKKIPDSLQKEIESRIGIPSKHSLSAKILSVKYREQELLNQAAFLLDIDFEDYLKKQQPYLTAGELQEMQKKGFTLGAHSVNHPLFSELSEEEQIRQVLDSVSYVSTTFHEPQHYFSFPFSDEGIQESVFQAIYEIVDLSFGITGTGTHHQGKHIARIDMEKYGKNAKEAVNKALVKHLYLKFKKNIKY